MEVRLKRATISGFKSFLEEKSNENSNISLQDKDLNTYLDDLFRNDFFEYKPKLEISKEIYLKKIKHYIGYPLILALSLAVNLKSGLKNIQILKIRLYVILWNGIWHIVNI